MFVWLAENIKELGLMVLEFSGASQLEKIPRFVVKWNCHWIHSSSVSHSACNFCKVM